MWTKTVRLFQDKGKSYTRWVRNVKKYGYNFDFRILNAADYGAYTSRKRFFGIFAKKGLPITFPEATHSKEGATSLFGSLEKWRPVRECLDFDDEGDSIFGRKKPLVEATLERIYAGLIKFVAGGKDAFLVKYNSVNKRTGKHILRPLRNLALLLLHKIASDWQRLRSCQNSSAATR